MTHFKFTTIIFAALLLFYSQVFAETVSEKDFSTALKVYQKMTSLQVSFTQKTILKRIGTELNATGELSLQRSPQKIVWEIKSPSSVEVTLTPNHVRMVTDPHSKNPQTEEFSLKDAAQNQGAQNPMALTSWLNLNAHELYTEYNITKTGANHYQFEPKDLNKTPFKKLSLELSQNGHMKNLVMDQKSGDVLQISFGTPKIKSSP